MSTKKWSHDGLMFDLAEYLGHQNDRIIWTDMQLGSSGSPRPDVYTIPKSYANFKPLAYECKVSVADFRSDITKGKWQNYLKFASGVIFAVPQGLINKDDIPKGCGLIVRSEKGWRMVKGPTLLPIKDNFPADCWIKLVIDGVDRSTRRIKMEEFNKRHVHDQIEKKYGQQLAILLSQRDCTEEKLQYRVEHLQKKYDVLDVFRLAEHQLEKQKAFEELKNDLCKLLGVEEHASIWSIQYALKEKIALLEADNSVQEMRKKVQSTMSSLERQLQELKQVIEPPFNVEVTS
ncbi:MULTISPECIES: MmcB family DNA repair protein [Acinetobacter]|uniref:MmcB family DNA repair protein n=1 Tax=Acinetobacter TaxID=469 RepID=UPI000693EA7D|nr:MmcB family DNA repair protein [Acinetobacter junii]